MENVIRESDDLTTKPHGTAAVSWEPCVVTGGFVIEINRF